MARWQDLGYKNYYEYRNALAREQGYTGYAQQRKARANAAKGQVGALKGKDIATHDKVTPAPVTSTTYRKSRTRAVKQAEAFGKPVPTPPPSVLEFPHTNLGARDQEVQNIREGLRTRKRFD